MESKKIINNSKLNSKVQSDDTEKALSKTFSESIKAMDTSRDAINPAVVKLLVEMNEKIEKENKTLKQNNDKILEKNSELITSVATLEEKIKWIKKNTFGESIFLLLMGVSAATFFTVSDEAFPKTYSAVAFFLLLIFCFIFKKD